MKEKIEKALPAFCFITRETTGETVIIRRGEKGFFPCNASEKIDAEQSNKKLGITPKQFEAMEHGSFLGFNNPGIEKILFS
jgi:hypothetical protein